MWCFSFDKMVKLLFCAAEETKRNEWIWWIRCHTNPLETNLLFKQQKQWQHCKSWRVSNFLNLFFIFIFWLLILFIGYTCCIQIIIRCLSLTFLLLPRFVFSLVSPCLVSLVFLLYSVLFSLILFLLQITDTSARTGYVLRIRTKKQ